MKARLLTTTLAPFAIASAVFSPGCSPTADDPLACREGSCEHQDELTFCDIDGVDSASSLPNECIAPPSADACNRVMACENPDTPHCTDDSLGTCVECTENTHCEGEETCDTRTGECTDEVIFACTPGATGDAECEAQGAGLDYCGDDEICVACLENEHCDSNVAEGICDQTSFSCRGCEANSECDSGLCGTNDEGVCVDEADVVYVGGSGASDGGACGTLAAPCATIGRGLEAVTGTRNVVLVAAGTYDERIDITAGTVKLIADGDVLLSPSSSGGNDRVVDVEGTTDVTIDGFVIDNSEGASDTDAVECVTATATLSIQNSTVRDSRNLGIAATDCTLNIESSHVTGNDGGGISIDDANYTILNSFITENGSGSSDTGGLRIVGTNDRTEVLEFNTIANNVRSGTTAHAIFCDLAAVTASNNIIMLVDASSASLITNCNTSFSLIDADSVGNTGTHTDSLSANAAFVDATNGDFHLASGSPGINAADPAATLTIDIDGEERPQGGRHDMGADEAE